jgi:hypothetical protein
MKTMILAAATVVSLGVSVSNAFAFGASIMHPSVYAAHAFPNEPYHTGTVFSEIFCHHAKSSLAVAHNATSTKGG